MIAAALAGTLLMSSFKPQTYCNPIDIDYGYTPIPNFSDQGRHRATADPVIVVFKGDYYLFSTNQWGYWWSSDMSDWHFVSRRFLKPWHKVYDELCAPAVWVQDDALYVIGSTYAKNFPIWKSTNPKMDDWKEAIEEFPVGAWDPAFFVDDDGRLYCYHGSSNDKPLWGLEIDPKTLLPLTENKALIKLNPQEH
jgi:xylan 1,4-beta-xylosidase